MATTGRHGPPEIEGAAASEEDRRCGLCARCVHVRRISSDRGSVFSLCGRSEHDTRFPRYPRLPVLVCAGYEPAPAKE